VSSLTKTLRLRSTADRGYQDGTDECQWFIALQHGWQNASDRSSRIKLALLVVCALFLILVGAVVEVSSHLLRLLGVSDHEW
jgi:hypothetical protein